jgi:kinesin family protein 1
MYVFINPKVPNASDGTPDEITWDFAQGEIAKAKGYATNVEGLSRDQQRAQEQVLELLPLIGEVNAMR